MEKELKKAMKLTEEVKIIFKNSEGQKEEITITVDKLLESTKDDLYDLLEETRPCTFASCNNESQNFCDCSGGFEDYVIDEVFISFCDHAHQKWEGNPLKRVCQLCGEDRTKQTGW